MKKKIGTMMSVMAFVSFSGHSAPEKITVDGGKVNFEGSVVAAPCAVDNTTAGQTVTLGQVPTNRLASRGDTSSAVPFSIKLTGCDLSAIDSEDAENVVSYTSASVIFSGATTGDDSTLAVQPVASGAADIADVAKNVGVQIFQNNQLVKVDGSTQTSAQSIVNGENEIPFSAAYVATANNVVAGSANSTVNFKISYE
ncbi:fimbrial protein [Enterobacter hormaechei]